jgi:hypothetical protein
VCKTVWDATADAGAINDRAFVGAGYQASSKLDNVTGLINGWYRSGTALTAPSWDTSAVTGDPLLTVTGAQITVSESSPLLSQPIITGLTPDRDVYGNPRSATTTIGAVQ